MTSEQLQETRSIYTNDSYYAAGALILLLTLT